MTVSEMVRWGRDRLVIASLCFAIALSCGRLARGEEETLHVFYRLNPPLIDAQGEYRGGFVYEFMKYVLIDKMKLVKSPDEFTEVPLARGLRAVEFNDMALFFNVVGSPDREEKFRLIKIPGVFEKTYLYARRGDNIHLNGVDDVVNYSVGVVNGSSTLQLLKKNIGTSLKYEIALNHESNLKMLLAGRVDLIAEPDYNFDYILDHNSNNDKVVKVMLIEKNNFYLAFNKNFEEKLFHEIEQAVAEAATEPVYKSLLATYNVSVEN